MSSNLVVTTELVNDHWLVTAELEDNSSLPLDIFVYENNGTDTLGEFFGTCSLKDLYSTLVFSGESIPTFGSRYIRYHQAKIEVPLEENLDSVIAGLVSNVKALSLAYSSKTTSTKVYIIP